MITKGDYLPLLRAIIDGLQDADLSELQARVVVYALEKHLARNNKRFKHERWSKQVKKEMELMNWHNQG